MLHSIKLNEVDLLYTVYLLTVIFVVDFSATYLCTDGVANHPQLFNFVVDDNGSPDRA